MKNATRILACLGILLFSLNTRAQTGIPSATPVTQNFDTLATSATATLPANWKTSAAGAGASTLAWGAAGNLTATTQAANSGTPTAGGRYNWGHGTTTTDRALGFMTSGGYASPNCIMTYYRNTSGSTIQDLTIQFDIERYRVNTTAFTLTFYTSVNGTAWTSRSTGDVASSVFATGTSAYNFTSGTSTTRTVTLTGVNLANNADFYAMWIFTTGSSNSQGVGLDNVSLTATLASSNSVTTTAASYGSPLCNASSNNISVAYTISGTYNAGNDFIAELSDASGSFTSATTIGTLSSTTTAGSVNATIPAAQTAGTGYRVRVRATNPATTGTDNGSNITISANPTIDTHPSNANTCNNVTTTFTVAATGTSLAYQWQGSANGSTGWADVTNATPTGSTYSNATTATLSVTGTAGYFYRAVVISGGCNVSTNAAELTVSGTAPTINTQPSNQSGIAGDAASYHFTVAATGSPTYQWQYSANGSSGWGNVTNSTPANYSYTNPTTVTLDVAVTASATAAVSYYRCLVTEGGCTATSNNATLTLADPAGFQLTSVNTPFTLTFDATVTGVNNGQFAATATSAGGTSPTTGQLNSNAWSYHATSSTAAATFGGTLIAGNLQSNGGVSTAGIYAFRVATGNYALGVQPTGSAWNTGGNYTLKLLNRTGGTVTGLLITYKVYVYNDQARSTTVGFSHSADNTTYAVLSTYNYNTVAAIASSPAWVAQLRQVYITGLSVAAGTNYYIRWTGIDNGGSGSRDELAFDDISVIANPVDPATISGSYETAILSGSATANAALNITGTLTMQNNATLASDGNLVLKSTSITETARIATLGTGADITGNVTVERFVAGGTGRRGWRTMSSPVQNLKYDQLLDDIFITGPGGSTNGFDVNGSNSSILTYEESATRGWKSISATSDSLTSGKGMLVFFRGDRTQTSSIGNSGIVPNNVVLDITGPINKNDIAVNLDFSSSGDTADQGWNLAGNPYPCEIIWSNVTKTAGVDAFFYVYDQSAGSYVTQSGSAQIASGQGFFVRTNATSQQITFEENDKASGNPTAYFKTAPEDFPVEMHIDSQLYDKAWIRFDENASAQYVFKEDARKFYNPVVNLSFVTSDNQDVQQHQTNSLAIGQTDTFQLRMSAPENTYYFSFPDLSAIDTTKTVMLLDDYLHTLTDLRTTSSYSFAIDSNPASSGNRFKIVFGTGNPLPVNLLDFSGSIVNGSVRLQWRTSGESNMDAYVVQRLNENIFEDQSSHRALNRKAVLSYTSNEGIAEAGRTYYYRLMSKELDGKTSYSKVIRLSASDNGKPALVISPNPASASFHILSDEHISKVALYDISGKYLHDLTLSQNTADVSSVKQGIYYVMITFENGMVSYQKLLVNRTSN